MRVEIEKITVSISKEEAFDIINCLTKSLDPFKAEEEFSRAAEFSQQLRSIFMNSVKGIHF